ncbi:MAG: hypothetical protein FGM24_04525 [Candidatus Kapabacteria bacterium]|nr:hypothetical protein [Candidatus Kapabacteria bacterium]
MSCIQRPAFLVLESASKAGISLDWLLTGCGEWYNTSDAGKALYQRSIDEGITPPSDLSTGAGQ